ncbi:MAG: hypothetical protein GY822_08405 [Deltaproteobacteria bacterium]|nr:hypothetical protein [Deltaproteobacteria bacterium]
MYLSKRRSLLPLLTASEAQANDAFTIDELGVPGIALLEQAGSRVAGATLKVLQAKGLQRVLVLTGPGNNGGDGWVAARHLQHHQTGLATRLDVEVCVLALHPPTALKGNARVAALAYERSAAALR